MKKFLSLVLALVMAMSLVTISAGAKDFTDNSKITYKEAVDVMSAVGVIDGYEDGAFNPTNTLTRGAAAKIICNMVLGPTSAGVLRADAAPFKDVPADNVFAGYIAYCSQQGIINGYADGTFRPSGTLNGFAFMKMLLGALGYDGETEDFVGSNWSISVAKLASALELSKGSTEDFVGTKAVTREEACLYAFNTLNATMVEYANGNSVTVNGVTFENKGTRSDMANTGSSDGNINKDKLMQFAEKYFTNLKKANTDSDDFGRPAVEWKYKSNSVGTYVDDTNLVATYTAGVDKKVLYDLVGKSVVDDLKDKDATLETYLDGVDSKLAVDDLFVKSSTGTAVNTGNGVLTEVYVNDEAGADKDETLVTVVSINTYLAQASSDYSSSKESLNITFVDDNGSVAPAGFPSSIDQEDFDVSDFKEDDYILVTYSKDAKEIKSVAAAEMLTGDVDTYKTEDSVTIDGTKYKYNKIVGKEAKQEEFTSGEPASLVMDAYGYIMYVDEATASSNYVYIQTGATKSELSKTAIAAAYFTDGTYKEATLKKVTDKDGDSTTNAAEMAKLDAGWYTYSVNSSDEYTLKAVNQNKKYDGEVVDFSAAKKIVFNDKVKFLDGSDIKANSSTVFLVLDSDDDVSVYTGVSNVPDVTTSSATTEDNKAHVGYVKKTSTGYATYVFIDVSDDAEAEIEEATTSDDYMFILKDSGKRITAGDDKYYEYDVILNGEVTTAKINDGDEDSFVKGVLYNKLKTNSDGYYTGAKAITTDKDKIAKTNQTDAIKYSDDTLSIGGSEYVIGSKAEIFLIVDGTAANKGLLDDSDADYETYLKIGGKSLVSNLSGYDCTYNFYAVKDDDDSDTLNVLYVWVTAAEESAPSNIASIDTVKVNDSEVTAYSSASQAVSNATEVVQGSEVTVAATGEGDLTYKVDQDYSSKFNSDSTNATFTASDAGKVDVVEITAKSSDGKKEVVKYVAVKTVKDISFTGIPEFTAGENKIALDALTLTPGAGCAAEDLDGKLVLTLLGPNSVTGQIDVDLQTVTVDVVDAENAGDDVFTDLDAGQYKVSWELSIEGAKSASGKTNALTVTTP